MKKIQIAGLTALTLLGSLTGLQAQSATTDPVGYVTIDIKGHGGTAASALTFARVSLVGATEFTSSTSTFSTGANNVLTDSSASFTAGDYMNGSEISHYLEITSGAAAGTITLISGSPGGTELYTVDDLSSVPSDSTYIIRKAQTVGGLFGATPTNITGGTTITSADEILILNATTGIYTSFWYSTEALFGTPEWKSTDAAIASPESYALFPTDGLLIVRKQSADTTLTITGSVKLTDSETLIEGSGYNIIAPLIPTSQLTPANSGFYTGDSATGIAGSTSITDADEILVYNPDTKFYTSFWYSTEALFGTPGWKSSDASILDVDNYLFPANTALLINRKSETNFTWTMPKTTTTN